MNDNNAPRDAGGSRMSSTGLFDSLVARHEILHQSKFIADLHTLDYSSLK